MTTNDKPVLTLYRNKYGLSFAFADENAYATLPDKLELYARPQPAAPQVPEHPALLLGDLRAAAAGMVGAIDEALSATPPAPEQPKPAGDVEAVVAEYLAARDAFDEATKPTGQWGRPASIGHGHQAAVRLREARAALSRLAAQPAQGEGGK